MPDKPTVLAVLFLVLESTCDAALVECALGAGLGEVGVRLGKETAGLGGVVPYGHVRVMLVQAGLGTVAAKLFPLVTSGRSVALGRGCGVLVGGFEGAVAVVPFGHVRAKPAVAWAVLIPEGMVDGEDGVAPFGRVQEKPEDLMVGTGMNGGGWHGSDCLDSLQNVRLDLCPLSHPPRIRRLLPSHPRRVCRRVRGLPRPRGDPAARPVGADAAAGDDHDTAPREGEGHTRKAAAVPMGTARKEKDEPKARL